jgi:hypothetical protein
VIRHPPDLNAPVLAGAVVIVVAIGVRAIRRRQRRGGATRVLVPVAKLPDSEGKLPDSEGKLPDSEENVEVDE